MKSDSADRRSLASERPRSSLGRPRRRIGGGGTERPESAAPAGVPPGAIGTEHADPSELARILSLGRGRAVLVMLGPAFVAAVAYVDPGNFATNIQSGAEFGYLLMWVVVVANIMAMLVQYLSAKLGVVTGHDLPELCRENFARPIVYVLWVQAELVAMATDLAEFVGAALGLNLVFHVPMTTAVVMTAVVAFAVLHLQSRGRRRFEICITALLGIVFLGFLYETLWVGPSPSRSLAGLVPRFSGHESVLLAVGIVGATIMPHVVYLHSTLTKKRTLCCDDAERSRVLAFQRLDVIVALGLASVVNVAMLAVAAKVFHDRSGVHVATLQQAHNGLGHFDGGLAALVFGVALLAAGISSSSVGTYAGQVVMRGFVGWRIPLFVRRAVTMCPAVALLLGGIDPTRALVLSQVALSFGIPFALVPLIMLTGSRSVMGEHVNAAATTVATVLVAAVVILLNGLMLWQVLGL